MRTMHILVGIGYCAVAVLNAGVALVLLVLARRSSQVVMWRGRQIRNATLRASTSLCVAVVFGAIGVDHLLPGPSNITAGLITGILMLAVLAAALTFEVIRHRRLRSGPNVVP
ncbi:hypothetical protein E1258_11055 [Micromonospora sp. KC207]|uniref:hypothetical protein n=1 Tax=Micromonospora sp. KC207 TaxID=2530377 RepID=UPI00104334E6|nr:hypothetical protein [Micromonospora sp. KC207]TDC61607.1 hypothetical protein E1258_11055 [Micromonospora sp. KC207]